MSLLDELAWRGLVHQSTHAELGAILEQGPLALYSGFDPTANSLHIGNLMPIMGLAHFQRAGHRAIALVGGGTGLIGDPSGKASERSLLTKEQTDANVRGIRKQLEHFLDFDGANAAVMANNADWLCALPLVDFLRDTGKHFTVNVMLAKESVRARIEDREHGMSFTEFSYSLLQAYDFLHLFDTHRCKLQIGGSDQWGNIVAGVDLIRRVRGGEAYGLTLPLVTKADGGKFGKTESGTVWLDPARTSPYRFYQFWINQSDADAPRYLRFFTFLPREEIEALDKQTQEAPHLRAAQARLAEEVTRLVHGEEALQGALHASKALFSGEIGGLDEATLLDVFSEAPSATMPRSVFEAARPIADVLVVAGVFLSKSEAKRLIQNGGLYLNNTRIESENTVFAREHCTTDSIAVVRKGKKNYHLLRVTD